MCPVPRSPNCDWLFVPVNWLWFAPSECMSNVRPNPPAGCGEADFAGFVGQTVLLPIFDHYGGTGTSAWYQVYGYAAFKISGYDFGGQYHTAKNACGGNGSDRCVIGYFTRFVELSDAWNYSPDAPQLGSSILRLIR